MNITTNTELLSHLTMSSYVFAIQILILSIAAIVYFSKNLSKSKKTKGRITGPQLPPGPRAWPIVGNLPELLMNRPTARWMHRVMRELDTDIASFRFGNTYAIEITCDKIAREVMKEKDTIFADRPEAFSASALTGGYLSAIFNPSGEQVKKVRRVMVQQLISNERLDWLHDQRVKEADDLVAYVKNLREKSPIVNVRDIVRSYCHGAPMRLIFGRKYFKESSGDGGLGPIEKIHVSNIFTALDYVYSFCISDYVPWLRGWDVDGQEKIVKTACDIVAEYNQPIIDERIEFWRKKSLKKEMGDWLDILVTLKDTDGSWLLSPLELRAIVRELFFAAVDNPANNIEWTIAEMLNRPETFKKAAEELDRVVGRDRLVQESDIPSLNYIKSCSREGYRLHPIVPNVVARRATRDTTLGGYFIPKGSTIHVSRMGLGRNPNIWENPDEFRPERHMDGTDCGPEVQLTETDMRFVTFSTGRRGCIASKLGTNMTIMLLARLLQAFTWNLPPGTDKIELEMSPENNLMDKPLTAAVELRLAPHLYPEPSE